MKRLLVILVPLALVACTTTQQNNIVSSVTKACKGEAAIYASYVALVQGGVLKASKQVTSAHSGVAVICANPAGMSDPYTALAQLTAATIVVASALKDAS